MRVYLKYSGGLLVYFKIVSIYGKILVFTLGNSDGIKLWVNENDLSGLFDYSK